MKGKLLYIALLIILFHPFHAKAQPVDYPRDTTYNIGSATRKILKKYPDAVPVKEFSNLPLRSFYDLVYSNAGNRDLHLDLFMPAGKCKNYPGVIFVHGGGWASGDRSMLRPLAQQLAARGFVCVTVEYRLSPEARYPAAVIDIKAAIKWLKYHGSEYRTDTSRIAVLGSSAGATIACLAGTTPQNPLYTSDNAFPGIFDRVQAIVNIDGALDLTDPAESAKDTIPSKPSAAARWFGCTLKENAELWKEGSPVNHTGIFTPPTLFVNSSVPRFHAGRDQYIKVLEENGIFYEIHTLPDSPHTFWLFDPWFDETLTYISTFLQKVFGG